MSGTKKRLLVGIYGGDASGPAEAYTYWMGSPPDILSVHGGEGGPGDAVGSIGFELDTNGWKGPKMFSFPLIYEGVTLADAAAGKCDAVWREMCEYLFKTDAFTGKNGQAVMDRPVVRIGWEHNGDWRKWQTHWDPNGVGLQASYRTAFARCAAIIRAADPVPGRICISWCPNIGQDNPADTYPGDASVDIVSIDWYSFDGWWGEPTNPADTFTFMRTRQFGLDWQVQFAKDHGKELAVDEFGIRADNSGIVFEEAFAYFQAHNYVYVNYWNSNAAYPGQMSPFNAGEAPQYPETAAAYRRIVRAIQGVTDAINSTPVEQNSMITLYFSGDSYNGAPVADITLDGSALPSVAITAQHGKATQAVQVPATAGAHLLQVAFNNDAWAPSPPGSDRNLYLEKVEGTVEVVGPVDFLSAGSKTFNVTVAAVAVAPALTSGVDYSPALAAILAELKGMRADVVAAIRIGAVSAH